MERSSSSRRIRWTALAVALCLVACGEDTVSPPVTDPGTGPVLDDALVSNLFDWPATEFGRGNNATIEIFRHAGDRAVDFELADLEGERHRLGELLRSAPVLLLLGSYTCPVYQARLPELDALAGRKLPDGRRFDEAVHFLHVYTVEAHPKLPDPTPYKNWTTGSDLPLDDQDYDTFAYSHVRQAYTWSERRANAELVAGGLQGAQSMWIDDLAPEGLNNPVWCTYGTAPNAAFLIDGTGLIVEAQLWADVAELKVAIEELSR